MKIVNIPIHENIPFFWQTPKPESTLHIRTHEHPRPILCFFFCVAVGVFPKPLWPTPTAHVRRVRDLEVILLACTRRGSDVLGYFSQRPTPTVVLTPSIVAISA